MCAAMLTPSLAIAQGRMTSSFGVRSDPFHGGARRHNGIDIAARLGSPVYATGDGWVVFSGWNNGGYGILVKINHMTGHETRFAHLSGIAVQAGNYVRKGQVVGYIGSTGRSTGPHLHYEVRYNGQPLDPRRFM